MWKKYKTSKMLRQIQASKRFYKSHCKKPWYIQLKKNRFLKFYVHNNLSIFASSKTNNYLRRKKVKNFKFPLKDLILNFEASI